MNLILQIYGILPSLLIWREHLTWPAWRWNIPSTSQPKKDKMESEVLLYLLLAQVICAYISIFYTGAYYIDSSKANQVKLLMRHQRVD